MTNKRYIILVLAAIMMVNHIFAQEQLTNIPTIYINTQNRQGVYSKETYVPCQVTIASSDASDVITDVDAGIRGRGNSTWGMAKKPYRLKFDKKIRLFGRPAKAKSWTLLANYADKTLMRNAVAFEISRFVGFDFSPSAVFVDVVLNDVYLGNYMVSDQMEVNKGRVDIDEMDETCISGDSLTGGYFLEIDGFGASEPVHFSTSKGLTITVKSPDDDVIQPVQLKYIKDYINKFESVLFSSNFDNPDGGFRKYVDEKTLVDWYICCELTGNSDSFWSTYIYKKRNDDHLYFGPLWDFDIAFNNDDRLGDAVSKLMRENAHDPKTWIRRIWQARWFQKAVYSRWQELRSQGIEDYILDYIDATAEYIDASQRMNFNKWRVLNTKVYREQFLFSTYQRGVDYLKSYVSQRIAFLDMSFGASGAESVIDDIKDGQEYYIVHYVGLFATPEISNFYIENPAGESQRLTFVSTSTPGVWCIRSADGRFVSSKTGDKYCTYTYDATDRHAQFTIEASPYDGYVCIRNLYTNQCLGIEHTAHYSRISTNKDGKSTNHAWKILPAAFDSHIDVMSSAPRYDSVKQMLVSEAPADFKVYDIYGRCVLTVDNTCEASVAPLSRGMYISRVGNQTIKFLKQ